MAIEQPVPIAEQITLAQAIIELASAEATQAAAEARRGSFDAAKRHAKLHAQIDDMLTHLDWLRTQALINGGAA